MNDFELGYLAAMIDAESHVGITRMLPGKRGRKTTGYVIRYELAMTDVNPINYVNSLLPSAKVIHQCARGRKSPYYRLRVIQQEAITLLRTLRPYVKGKQALIDICLEMDALRNEFSPSRNHYGKNRFQKMPEEYATRAADLYQKYRTLTLNKGRQPK